MKPHTYNTYYLLQQQYMHWQPLTTPSDQHARRPLKLLWVFLGRISWLELFFFHFHFRVPFHFPNHSELKSISCLNPSHPLQFLTGMTRNAIGFGNYLICGFALGVCFHCPLHRSQGCSGVVGWTWGIFWNICVPFCVSFPFHAGPQYFRQSTQRP